MPLRDRANPLFFRQDGGLDLSQAILVALVVWVVLCWTAAGLEVLRVSVAAWAFLGSFVVVAFITWAARDRAELLAKSRTPGEVAGAIANAVGGTIWTDDETADPSPVRDYDRRTSRDLT